MPSNTHVAVRRSERESELVSITLVTRPEVFRQDESATTLDTSLHGMKVRTALSLIPGEWVGVIPKGEFPHAIPAHVVWVQAEESGYWTVAGIEFESALAV
jgi:PilZ domain